MSLITLSMNPNKKVLKWGMDYLKQCHPKEHKDYPNIVIGQVGNGETDHNYLGTPEDMKFERPIYKRIQKKFNKILLLVPRFLHWSLQFGE